MKLSPVVAALFISLVGNFIASAQTGPFSPEDWPLSKQVGKRVHYIVNDEGLPPPSETWVANELMILTGGDQGTADLTIAGHTGKKVTGSFLNVADQSFGEWADDEFIDILIQAYGDAALFNGAGQPRNFNFLTGTLPELNAPNGGQVPLEAKNKKWNWILFRIPNGTRASDGSRLIGSIPANAQGSTTFGGVNGGTIRFENVSGLTVRAVALGELGAFGEPEDINQFAAAEGCDPEPLTNWVGLDLAQNLTNHLVVLDDRDHTVTFENGVGPANDKRRAVRPAGAYLNFGITDGFLGKPCNDPHTIKVCVDYYDDPAFAGAEVRFGPEAYATDDRGGLALVPADKRATLTGSGQWVRRSWTVPAVNLKGVNTGTLTGGPRFISENGQVAVSRVELAVLRTGNHALAGLDPLAACFEDPTVCTDVWGNSATLDLAQDLRDGLEVGTSSGDQEMVVAEAGPASDRRLAVRPARDDGTPGLSHQYLNFSILEERFGPSSQPPARLAMCVTYYDDPALVGARFKPEVYSTERNGVSALGFTPDSYFVTLEGTDRWREAYWEIPDVKFNGVNQGPQAAARFVLNDKIFVTSVRYAVIRPCGPNADQNLLAACQPVAAPVLTIALGTDNLIVVTWSAAVEGFSLEATADSAAPAWQAVNLVPVVEGTQRVVRLPIGPTTFYRLAKP